MLYRLIEQLLSGRRGSEGSGSLLIIQVSEFPHLVVLRQAKEHELERGKLPALVSAKLPVIPDVGSAGWHPGRGHGHPWVVVGELMLVHIQNQDWARHMTKDLLRVTPETNRVSQL